MTVTELNVRSLALAAVERPEREPIWSERPVLQHLHDFARGRRCSPWAVLGVALARVVAATPPQVVLPPLVGGYGSLNVFVALVGSSGSGKGAAESAARDALHLQSGEFEEATIGSGEGIGHLYGHREKGEFVRDRYEVLFTIPEVDNLTALGSRQGSTLLPQLRVAWSGERLGFSYADPTKRLPIDRHTYRMGLVLGVQPARAATLLDDADGGTPQRFVWMPAVDPDAPDVRPATPEPIPLPAPRLRAPGFHVMHVPAAAERAVDAEQLRARRGESDGLDGHRLFCQLKVAGALALLDGRADVDDDDWRLASAVMSVSDRTREAVREQLASKVEAENEARGRRDGLRAVIAEDVAWQQGVQRVGRWVAKRLEQVGETAQADVRRACASRDRRYLDAAVQHLVAGGQVAEVVTAHSVRLRAAGAAS